MSEEGRVGTWDFYYSTSFFNKKFNEVISPLLDSFVYKKGFPLDLEESAEYYTSTTSTTLLALHHVGVLSEDLLTKIHETLFWLKDNTVNPVVKRKLPEDNVAWDVSEGASVWATSLALWALIETGYKGEKNNEIHDATLWLVDQQRDDGGWGFDKESPSRIYFTVLALNALQLSINSIPFSSSELERIKRVKQHGLRFILQKCERKQKFIYWKTKINQKDLPDLTSTLYALWILYKDNPNKWREIIKGGIEFLRREIKGKEIWEFRKFIEETQTKYGTHKVIISYTPSIPIPLLKMGVHPFDELCLKPIMWLRKNKVKNGWSLPGHSEHALSFTTAYALWTITEWHKHVIKEIGKKTEVYPFTLRRLRRRISVLIGVIIALVTSRLFPVIANPFYSFLKYYNTVDLISLIASYITIFSVAILLIKYLDAHVFNTKISRRLRRIKNIIEQIVYVK